MRRLPRRWIKWIALGVVAVFVLGTLLIAPAQAGRAVKSSYHALPAGFKSVVPDALERGLGQGIDGVTRFFSFGDPHRLIELDLRLEAASLAPGSWGPDHALDLNWSDLGGDIEYEVRPGHEPQPGGVDVGVLRVANPGATVALPGDGDWYVHVRPFVGTDGGRTSTFGPFRIDSTIPPAPVLNPIPPPPGYTFSLSWSPVSDESGIMGYQVERLGTGSLFHDVGLTSSLSFLEDQLGNGKYTYRIRAINGAGLLSLPSNLQVVSVMAPMSNPGVGAYRYGIHANYTSFIKLWDLTDPGKYASVSEVPPAIEAEYLGGGYGFEIDNATLVVKTREVVGGERNTFKIAEKLFIWLFDYADYDSVKLQTSLNSDDGGLQRAGETYDRRKGICGDLATLYITMLRIAGVPARPVHGYLDNDFGDNDPTTGIGDFHVWVEVWVGESVRPGADPADTRNDWMTVDVSGITGAYEAQHLMVYFGIFNPEYLALGTDADYNDSSWNSWAQFGWTKEPGTNPKFTAAGRPVELESKTMNLFFNPTTKERVLVEKGAKPPSGFASYFPDVKVVSKKRIDYGVNLTGTPISATIRIRYPVADAFAAVLPWQSVIFTVYQKSDTVDPDPATNKPYRLTELGYVVWEDDFER